MSKAPPDHRETRQLPYKDRRGPPQSRGKVMRSIRALFSRPLALARRDGKVHVVLVDRRKASDLIPLRTELLTRMKDYARAQPARSMAELVFVYRVLGREGWVGVEALDRRVLGLALDQAERLRGRRTSDFLETVIARLRAAWLVAVQRDRPRSGRADRGAAPARDAAAPVEFQLVDEP